MLRDRIWTGTWARGNFGRDQLAFSLFWRYQFAVSPSCNDDADSTGFSSRGYR